MSHLKYLNMKFLDDLKAKLTPKTRAERERLKRLAVYTLLTLSCLVCLWLIFAPSGGEETTKGKANMELPDQTSEGMPKTKIAAYEQEDMQKEKAQNESTINAVTLQLDTVAASAAPAAPDEIQNSANAYQQAQASLQDFYVPDYSQTEQVAELQARIDELEMQNSIAQQQTQQPNEMELLERSYQLAAQYMGNGNGNYQAPPQSDEKGKRNVQPVQNVTHNVVSTLSAATNERGFNTSVSMKRSVGKNTIAAVIAGNQSVTNGQSVKLRTTEPMWIGNRLIPRNTTVVGAARLQDERLEIEITSVETNGSIYEVELKVYDSDGQEGINIPNSMESDALHEIGANMGSTMGSSINISTDAGAQIASDVGRGLINGVSQYLTKKMRTVKVHLKSGYRVMLYQPENN
ncbi:conjugative transposon protein TraM [Muribaculum intestinale]|uniref:Conjugative transposon protein TraM n=2 Tax=Muribaculum intestinale TaxID=1796646 RepID=A0A4S2FIY2_9BACT|nr:conjugative transposon protein TraM [Muribaculum intestinale]TGY68846.1 conjugative transposon protein TraM [Muribaculum intestinale]